MNTPNNSHDDSEKNERAFAPLEQRLATFYGAQKEDSLALDAFWQRLAPRLDARDGQRHASTPVADATDAIEPNHSLSTRHTRHISDDIVRSPSAPSRLPVSPISDHPSRVRRTVTNLVSVGAVAVICLAALAIFHIGGLGESGQQGVAQRVKLEWSKVQLPAGVVLFDGGNSPTPANGTPTDSAVAKVPPAPNSVYFVMPNDGNVAYICQSIGMDAPRIWRTTDAGHDWAQLPALPLSGSFEQCGIRADANDANTVFVYLKRISDNTVGGFLTYVLFAGAAQWQPLVGDVVPLTSAGDTYYRIALRSGRIDESIPPSRQPQAHLYRSTDRMRTWQPINDAPLVAEDIATQTATRQSSPVGVMKIWVQPKTGEILAQTYDGALWRSTNQGQDWTQLDLPALPPASELTPVADDLMSFGGTTDAIAFVQQPIGNRPFALCAIVFHQQPIVFNVAPLYCSSDSGQTWIRRPRTAVHWGNGKSDTFELPWMMLGDGSLIAWDVQTISVFPGNNTAAPAAHVIGTIPSPIDPNSIPSGQVGVASGGGAVLWQPHDADTLYVATYRPIVL
jgi:hypothetical protein